MAETVSQRVNALFASYVATEAEQERLGRLGTVEAGRLADALGEPAMAIRDEIFAIRDRSACPDLVAARILLDLMLAVHWNADGGPVIGAEDREATLPMLEILSGSLTGAVREQARIALATIGVDVPTEAPATIEAMTRELCTRFGRSHAALTEDESEALCLEFDALQERIIRAEPVTARDVALQFMADNFFGTTDNSDEFEARLKTLAGIAPPDVDIDDAARRHVEGSDQREAA